MLERSLAVDRREMVLVMGVIRVIMRGETDNHVAVTNEIKIVRLLL